MKKYSYILFLLFLLWGCSARKTNKIPPAIAKLKNLTFIPANVQPIDKISFKRDAVYGESKKVLIGRINGISVGNSGKVFIADGQKITIDVFKPDGSYLTQLGRKGKGPGEFQFIDAMKMNSGRLYVYDGTLRRMDVFSLDSLKLFSTINLIKGNWGNIKAIKWSTTTNRFFPRENGSILMGFTSFFAGNGKSFKKPNTWYRYYMIYSNGQIDSDQILAQHKQKWTKVFFRGTHFMLHLPFSGRSLIVGSKNGKIFTAWTDDFLIKEYDPDGNYMSSIYIPYHKKLIVRSNLEKQYKHQHMPKLQALAKLKAVRTMKIPKTWPALNDMKIDNQNRLWVSTIVKNMKVYQWWVLNPNGKLIARFDWPRSKPIEVVRNGYLYTQETDTTTGISKIVRYRVIMNNSR